MYFQALFCKLDIHGIYAYDIHLPQSSTITDLSSLGLSHIHSVLPFLRRNDLFKRWNICHFTSWWRTPSWYMKNWTIKRNCTDDKVQLFSSSAIYSITVDEVWCFRGLFFCVLAWDFWFPNTSSSYIVFFYFFKKFFPF